MKGFLFILSLISIFSINASGQKTKTLTIYQDRNNSFHVRGIVHYDANNAVVDTSYYLSTFNDKYTTIYDALILKSGTIQEVYNFIAAVLKAGCTEETNVTVTIDGCRVHVCNIPLRTTLVYEQNGSGYSECGLTKLRLSLEGVEKYCRKHSIPLVIAEKKFKPAKN
jgi:hypothetical protein